MLYKDAGVDIKGGERFVDFLKKLRNVANIGEFASIIDPGVLFENFNEPVILTSVDGIGTKIILALRYGRIEGLAQDIVAMVFNDLAVYGATPLFLLDYIATSKLDTEMLTRFFRALDDLLSCYGIKLIGGETAELPDMLTGGLFDIAGFGIGVTEREFIERRRSIKPGDLILSLPSSGIHSNGFTLVRKVLEEKVSDVEKEIDEVGTGPLINHILEPTRVYIEEARELFKGGLVKAAVHVTGGGIEGNLKRICTEGLDFIVEKRNIEVPPIFYWLRKRGEIPDEEMWRVFNMGVGFIFISSKDIKGLKRIGYIEKGKGRVLLL